MILLRVGLLPLVIDRDLRVEYIEALESADSGSLAPLANMFARLERKAILQALSVDVDAEISPQQSLTSVVISSLQDKFGKRRIQKLTELRRVNDLALELRQLAESSLASSFKEIESTVAALGRADSFLQPGGSDHGNGHWYKSEVACTARDAGKFANFSENHYFMKASIRVGRERLVFVISFHHVGRDLTGIMEVTAFRGLNHLRGPTTASRLT